MYPYFQCFSRIFFIDRLSLMFAYLHTHVGASNLRFRIVSIFISLIPQHICYEVTKRSRPSYPRDTANRSDLILQGGPNQHSTHKPNRTTHTNHSPPRLELQEPAQRHIVSRALRETTKSKHMQPTSPLPLDYPRSWVRVPVLSKQRSTRLTGFDYLILPACG